MLGDSGVGKTSVLTRVVSDEFDSKTVPTIGVGVRAVTWEVEGVPYKFHLWDTAGQEVYRTIVPIYFRNATMALLFLAMNNRTSFERLNGWLELLREKTEEVVPVVVVANKVDLPPEISEREIREWAHTAGGFPVFLTSALTGCGIGELFDYVAVRTAAARKPVSTTTGTILNEPEDKDKQNCC
jgi:small GTP-binding protein